MVDVSVIIPVYNAGREVERTLSSVVGQAEVNLEVICVDDASTDNTLDCLTRYAQADRRIKVLHHARNCGQSQARHTALEASQGQYIYFADAGDHMLPGALSALLKRAQATRCDVTVMNTYIDFGWPVGLREFSSTDAIVRQFADGIIPIHEAVRLLVAKRGLQGACWDKLYSRSVIDRSGVQPVNWNVGEDYYFNARVLPWANGVAAADVRGYVYAYSGLSRKYYYRLWEEARKPYFRLLSDIPAILSDGFTISSKEYAALVDAGFLGALREAVAVRIFHRWSNRRCKEFVDCEMRAYKSHRDRCISIADTLPCVEDVYADGRAHLRRHRKFFTFTWILDKFRI